MIELVHGRVRLALTERNSATSGLPLLLLHELGATSDSWGDGRDPAIVWDGPVFALDFSGHGSSGPVRGGAYTPELLAGDADAALRHIGTAAIAGLGVGAYVALLLAGGRPDSVPAALLGPGRGLLGGGAVPDPARTKLAFAREKPAVEGYSPDPRVAFLDFDIRPSEYAEVFAEAASHLILLEDDGERPPWWTAVRPTSASVSGGLGEGLRCLAERCRA